MLEELEEILICADVGYETTEEIIERMREKIKDERISDPDTARQALKQILREMLGDSEELTVVSPLTVILVIGVNGVGKTTSIAKMAGRFKDEGKKVLLAAADTFRAAAIDQLSVWADRIGVDLIKQTEALTRRRRIRRC